jgi:HNH endonuclease
LASEAEIIPAVLSGTGQPLWLGRTRRLASAAQTYALHARDGGCSFPSCTTRPEWCEKHHIVEWAAGGRTDVDNLTLLCGYHHGHFLKAGWSCHLGSDGLPYWMPPRWLDPTRTPMLNHRIRVRHQPVA